MMAQCGACAKEEHALEMVGFMKFRVLGAWRMRNADIGLGSVLGSFVMLCSDICERRYAERIGFADDVCVGGQPGNETSPVGTGTTAGGLS